MNFLLKHLSFAPRALCYGVLFGLLLGLPRVSVFADETWGPKMFAVKKHDFGRVAIGSDAVFQFKLQNIYEQDIRILSAQSSCGCTNVSIPKEVLKSEEVGAVVATFNTSGQHTREKSATLTVQLETRVDGHILRDTVQLFVSGYIRPDVVLTPGSVEFGSVAEGNKVVRSVRLEYAGRPDWALTKIERSNPHIHARAEQLKREGGEVSYRITVTLKDNAPVGYVKDVLRFTTNETKPGMNEPVEIVLPIQGLVMAPIQAKPSPFMAGFVSTGESVSKNLVVRSETPFRILSVDSEDKRFRFSFPNQESPIQIVSVVFTAEKAGAEKARTPESENICSKVKIRTNLPDQEFVLLDAHACLATKDFLASANGPGPASKPVGETEKPEKPATNVLPTPASPEPEAVTPADPWLSGATVVEEPAPSNFFEPVILHETSLRKKTVTENETNETKTGAIPAVKIGGARFVSPKRLPLQ